MKLSTILLGALAPIAFATECLNEDFDYDPLNITAAQSRQALKSLRARDLTQVQLYIHILVSANPTEDYGPSIQGQLDYLNAHYNVWGFNFNLGLTTYVIDPTWASGIDVDKENKMNQLHRGDYQTLNVYLQETAGGGVCSLPSSDPIDQAKLNADGCFVSLEVGRDPNSGTLAHEVGHWLGLLHVAQGGCAEPGDNCDDTAPQAEQSYAHMATPGDLQSCPAKESCSPGLFDNVKNFMDYTDCAQEFTPCQGGRMNTAWTTLRNGRKLEDGVVVTW